MDAGVWAVGAQCVVIPVNCVGVMGAGLAADARQRYPGLWHAYRRECDAGHLAPGRVLMFLNRDRPRGSSEPFYIAAFPTKRHWREQSHIEDIAAGLPALVTALTARSLFSVAVPALGCGLGGLSWENVKPIITDAFSKAPEIELKLFPPIGT